jgi:hypothetical protein
MASAYVGSPMKACHLSTGIWLVRMVEAAAVTFLEDLVEVTTGAGVERFEAPIVGGIRPGTGVRIRLPPAVSPANFDTTRAGRRLKEGMAVGRAAAGDRGLTEKYKNGR